MFRSTAAMVTSAPGARMPDKGLFGLVTLLLAIAVGNRSFLA